MNDKFWLHKKTGGIYKFLYHAQIEATLDTVVVYESMATRTIWVRPTKEFFDGRFTPLVHSEGTPIEEKDLT
jgi:hypothetical protein